MTLIEDQDATENAPTLDDEASAQFNVNALSAFASEELTFENEDITIINHSYEVDDETYSQVNQLDITRLYLNDIGISKLLTAAEEVQ
ncbi:sigma-70 factor domain-containing protein [Chromatium okenii]